MNFVRKHGFFKGLSFGKRVVTSYFLLLLGIGVVVLPSMGIAWNEPAQRLNAGISLIEVTQKVASSLVPASYWEFSK